MASSNDIAMAASTVDDTMDGRTGSIGIVPSHGVNSAAITRSYSANAGTEAHGGDMQSTAGSTTQDTSQASAPETVCVSSARTTVGPNRGRQNLDLVGIGAQFGSSDTVTAPSNPQPAFNGKVKDATNTSSMCYTSGFAGLRSIDPYDQRVSAVKAMKLYLRTLTCVQMVFGNAARRPNEILARRPRWLVEGAGIAGYTRTGPVGRNHVNEHGPCGLRHERPLFLVGLYKRTDIRI